MKLYFLRHGIAEDGFGKSDFERELTAKGRERMKVAARVMASLDLGLTAIYSSPRVRAVQTAAIAAKTLGMEYTIRDELNFNFDARAIKPLMRDAPPDAGLLLVGHEPTFSSTINELTGASIIMKKGGLARVDITYTEPLRGLLVWLIAPKVFDTLD